MAAIAAATLSEKPIFTSSLVMVIWSTQARRKSRFWARSVIPQVRSMLLNEARGVAVGELAEEDGVGDTENRGRGADSEGDGDDGREGEDGALAEGAGSVEDIFGKHDCN